MADDTMDSIETLDADGVLRRSLLKAVAAVPLLAAMAARASAEEPQAPQQPPSSIFVKHAHDEHQVDLGEVVMNYATAGAPGKPALLLIPPQTRSWWNYEAAMKLLGPDFQVFAVDLRGQGRSSRRDEMIGPRLLHQTKPLQLCSGDGSAWRCEQHPTSRGRTTTARVRAASRRHSRRRMCSPTVPRPGCGKPGSRLAGGIAPVTPAFSVLCATASRRSVVS